MTATVQPTTTESHPVDLSTDTILIDAPTAAVVADRSALGDRYTGVRYLQLVLVLGALVAIGALTIDTYLPALPSLTADFHTTAPTAQLTITGLMAGLGVGQLVIGPLSDAIGRRKPLIAGLVAHTVMSVLCALAPTIGLLIAARVLQGLAGAAVSVVAMAMVRDLFSGVRAARLLSRLTLVMGISPILAPTLGSALLKLTAWRGIFVFLAVVGALLIVLAALALPETLAPERRVPARVRSSLASYASLFRDPTYLIMVVIAGLMFATVFGYIGGSSFVLQEYFKLTPGQYGIAFGVTALGLIIATQLNPSLVQRFSPVAMLCAGVLIGFVGAVLMVLAASTGFGGLVGFMAALWITIAGAGLTFPNAPAIALTRHGESAGTAAALLGAAQFVISGISAPLVGELADGTPMPMSVVMLGTSGLAAILIFLGRRLFADVEA